MVLKDFLDVAEYNDNLVSIVVKNGDGIESPALTVVLGEKLHKFLYTNENYANYVTKDEANVYQELRDYLYNPLLSIIVDDIKNDKALSKLSDKFERYLKIIISDNMSTPDENVSWADTKCPVLTVREMLKMIFPVDANNTPVEIDLINLSIFGTYPSDSAGKMRFVSHANKTIFDPSTATMVPMARYKLSYEDLIAIIHGTSKMMDEYLNFKVLFISPILNKTAMSMGAAICLFITA